MTAISPKARGVGGAMTIFASLLVLLVGAVVWVGLSWQAQRELSRRRTALFGSLLTIRNLRDSAQSASLRAMLGSLGAAREGTQVAAAVREDLEKLTADLRGDDAAGPLLTRLDESVKALDDAVHRAPEGGSTPGVLAWFEASEAALGETVAAVNEIRTYQSAKFNVAVTEASDSAAALQAAMLAVLVIAVVGMGLGAGLVVRENRRRDRTERALRDRDEKLERAERIARIGYWVNDRAAETVAGSAEYFRILGIEATDCVGVETVFGRIHPDDVGEIVRQHKELEQDHRPRRIGFRVIRGGEVRHVEAHVTAEVNRDGRLARTFGTLQDVTEVRAAEVAAREWRERFEAAIRAARQLVYEREVGSDAIRWQGSSEEVLGVPGGSIDDLGAWKSLVHPDDTERYGNELRRSSVTRSPFALEYRVRRADGRDVPVLDRAHWFGGSGGTERVIGMIFDLSERKRREQELLQAQKLESIGRLAGGIAHDLNNWLTAMLGYVDLARGARNGEQTREFLGRIEEAGHSAAKMTSQLLSFARRQVIEPRVCSLNDVVRGATGLISRLIGENIELRAIPSPGLWPVRVDPSQFEQVVVNLAINARDAMPTGGRLTIETRNVTLDEEYATSHPEVTPGPHVLLAISDTGSGIPPDQIGKIFEPFYSTKPRGMGTGLGLATVLGLVKQHKGHIWVYSEVGKGTTFKIYVPRDKDSPAPGPKAARSARPARSVGNETILIVEDEVLVRQLAVALLREQGYQVLEAESAKRAVELATSHPEPIHMLLTDVIMPGMSGKQIAQSVLQARPGIKVLYTSGYTDNVVVHHGILDEGIHFLQKPYTPTVLTEKVREVLDAATKA